MRWGWFCRTVPCFLAGCGPVLALGTDIVWSADNEAGNLSAWSDSPGIGGSYGIAGKPTIGISSEHAHSGVYSVRLASSATNLLPAPYFPGGAALYKQREFPQQAYYSAWYFVPRAVPGVLNWNIIRFGSPAAPGAGTPFLPGDAAATSMASADGGGASGDAGVSPPPGYDFDRLFDVRLRSQPNGDMTVVLFDHRQSFREERMPNPVPIVPIGQWFQIEIFYHNAADTKGHLSIWLDGILIYDIARPMSGDPAIYFSPCSLVEDSASVELFIDDVAVSWTRVTPRGVLTL